MEKDRFIIILPLLLMLMLILSPIAGISQSIDSSLDMIRQKLDQVQYAEAEARLSLEVSFINMPEKTAMITFEKGKDLKYTSENFIIIPKKGLDFTWDELFAHDFISVDRGYENDLKVLNIIPNDPKADFAIMTLWIDEDNLNISKADITTKNEGSFLLDFAYEDNGFAFPSSVTIRFQVEKIKIPLNFMGKDVDIDKDELKSEDPKEGVIYLDLDWRTF